jgi:hypothetical protein
VLKKKGRPFGAKDCIPPKIEKGIPIPGRTGRREIYPWSKMEPGDSLFFKDRFSWDVNVMAWKAGKRHGFKYALKKEKDGVRVWRLT